MTDEDVRMGFVGFLERLIAAKGHVGRLDWSRYIVAHYLDEEMEEVRRTVARLGGSWAYREWPAFNLELVAGWIETLRRPPAP